MADGDELTLAASSGDADRVAALIAAGADVSWMDAIMKNILPVTVGNIIAGAIFVSASNSYMHGKLGGHSSD